MEQITVKLKDHDALARIRDLLQRAEAGDQTVLPDLRCVLDTHPQLWQHLGDLARQAESAWLDRVAGANLLLRESVSRKQAELKAQLGDSSGSPLEKLLVDRVAACWLQLQYADYQAAQLQSDLPSQHRICATRQNAAQRRYLHALKTLATVRKLLFRPPAPMEIASRWQSGRPVHGNAHKTQSVARNGASNLHS